MQFASNVVSQQDVTYTLSNALLLYRSSDGNKPVFASIHDVSMSVSEESTHPVIEAGVAVSKSGLLEMFKALTPEEYTKPELFEANLLAKGQNHLVWFCAPSKRDVWFKCNEIGEGEVTAKTSHPGLVFAIVGGQWYVFAVKSNAKPTAKTPLYVAPYLNVWEGGHICVGNIDQPKGQSKFQPDAWEESFFRSFFTHTNIHNSEKITKFSGGIYALWRELLKGRSFPKEYLVPMKKTLGEVFNELVRRAEKGE